MGGGVVYCLPWEMTWARSCQDSIDIKSIAVQELWRGGGGDLFEGLLLPSEGYYVLGCFELMPSQVGLW